MDESSKPPNDGPALHQEVGRERSVRVRRTLHKTDVLTRPDTDHRARVMSAFVKDSEDLWDNVPL